MEENCTVLGFQVVKKQKEKEKRLYQKMLLLLKKNFL